MKKLFVIMLLCLTTVYGVISCNKSSDSSPTDNSGAATTYQGAGSKWSIAITGANFVINKYASAGDTTPEMTISGTLEKYANQFVKLTVASASGSNAPSAGSVAYGLEVPGYAFFLKPIGGNSEPIIMVQSGTCPTTSFDANWIIAKTRSDFTPPMTSTIDFFGGASMNFNGASSSLTVNQYEPITGAVISTGGGNGNGTSTMPFNIGNCSNGLLRVHESGNDYFDMYFTSSGGALVKFPGGQIIFVSPKQNSAVTQASIAGTYSGVVFNDSSSGDSVFPVKLSIPTSGNSNGIEITDVAADTVSSDGVVFSNIASTTDSSATQLPSGMFRADLNSSSATTNGKVSCAYSTISSTKIIACTGFMNNTGGDARRPFFILARSR
ncbi:MAG: hypothetical protein JNL11_14235 [Bdellovibrionaceae bacterium]|nr:hypothetical protein [Pseudobdellovibrionaceae bacterium]